MLDAWNQRASTGTRGRDTHGGCERVREKREREGGGAGSRLVLRLRRDVTTGGGETDKEKIKSTACMGEKAEGRGERKKGKMCKGEGKKEGRSARAEERHRLLYLLTPTGALLPPPNRSEAIMKTTLPIMPTKANTLKGANFLLSVVLSRAS